MIIIWDCKSGRREFIEIAIKKEGLECYSCSDINSEQIQLVKSLEPKIIVSCAEYISEIRNEFTESNKVKVLELGSDISLPLNPLSFLKKVVSI